MRKRQKIEVNNRVSDDSLISRAFSILLALTVLAVQVFLPIAPALANEVVEPSSVVSEAPEVQSSEDESSETVEPASVEVEEDVDDQQVEEADVPPTVVPEVIEPDAEYTIAPVSEVERTDPAIDDPSTTVDPSPDTSTEETNVDDVVETEDGSDTPSSETATTTEDDSIESIPVVEEEPAIDELDESSTTTPEDASEVIDDTPASEESEETTEDTPLPEEEEQLATTTETTVVMPELHTVQAEGSQYTFSIDDCARVADGSFYCTEKSKGETVFEDRVFAAPDADGDSEIFIEKDGEMRQLTFNTQDDAAPYYDDRSKTIVFHRLVDARYQIISLDLSDGVEQQLTFDSYNNMQPTRYDDLIVWQGWVGNDWEVLMSEDGEVRMLTDNTTHDIGPRINGEYIIWQAEKEDGWEVRVYNTLTGMTESIDDTNGASIENPRLVLVYDAKHENGDVETRGYDLLTGENVALHSEAPKMPDELPDPDQTGEDRALITSAQQKVKTEDEEGEPEELPLEPEAETPVLTNQDPLLIPPFDSGSSTPVLDVVSSTTQPLPTIEDLVIPAVEATTTVISIPDLEILPLKETLSEDTDPQG